jgi:hypothetical protein
MTDARRRGTLWARRFPMLLVIPMLLVLAGRGGGGGGGGRA